MVTIRNLKILSQNICIKHVKERTYFVLIYVSNRNINEQNNPKNKKIDPDVVIASLFLQKVSQ